MSVTEDERAAGTTTRPVDVDDPVGLDGGDEHRETAGPEIVDPAAEARPRASSARRRRRRIAARVLLVLALTALVTATVALRVELGDRRADADRSATAERRLADGRRDAELVAAAVAAQLVQAQDAADVSAAERDAQVARLAELGLTEDDMERALDDAQAATAALEADRDALDADVARQAVEDVELQSCLVEVRRAVDAAFQAANRPGVEVPATREICRALSRAR